MSYEITPSQITALQNGEAVRLLVRMEPQDCVEMHEEVSR